MIKLVFDIIFFYSRNLGNILISQISLFLPIRGFQRKLNENIIKIKNNSKLGIYYKKEYKVICLLRKQFSIISLE
jgi:hypothetical protein